MKHFFLLALMTFSFSSFARQYIQCSMVSETTDVAVVNLTTPMGGTLFLSSGMQNDESERILVNIAFDKTVADQSIFKIQSDMGEGQVTIPSNVISKSSDSFLINVAFANLQFDYFCFSRLYND
jgi:hypothetical protein